METICRCNVYAMRKMFPNPLIMAASICFLAATPAATAELTLDISVLNPQSFEQAPPSGDTRWVIEGPGNFSLAEQHGALPSMTFNLPAGAYRVTVWEISSGAAAEHRATLRDGEPVSAYLLLTPDNSGLIDVVMERMNREEPGPPQTERAMPGAVTLDGSTLLPDDDVIVSAPGDTGPSPPAQLRVVHSFAPGAPIDVLLPVVPDDPSDDFVGIDDGRPGWAMQRQRGTDEAMTLTAPELPGRYLLQYVAVPSLEVLAEAEITVE
ncbi:hypothetical protein [Loktanella sp. SALINAS62]|uniref:hypothetical protein n=1 Tax=Loktanella sp. SALINAS62 TaxID=2706124 RepID=UPI001B8BDCB2|nr:hypothetical protein [Loktanella sp. SALINAS62]MBS1303396.1 hypothetical protein [Loktanella sp. SALINAS62]